VHKQRCREKDKMRLKLSDVKTCTVASEYLEKIIRFAMPLHQALQEN